MLGALVAVLAVALVVAIPAASHPDPPGCTQAALSFDWGPGLNIIHRNGDVVAVNARVGNDQIPSGACDITDATITLTFPDADGSSDGQQFVLATNVDLPANEPKKSFGKRNLTIAFDPGVFRGFVTIGVQGVIHYSEPDPTSGPISSAGRPAAISRPHTTLTVDHMTSGASPFTVAYEYSVENDSPEDPAAPSTTPAAYEPSLSDSGCAGVEFVDGDTLVTSPSAVDPGETWRFACERPLPAGSLVNRVVFTGVSGRDGRPWPTTRSLIAFCGRQPATIIGTDNADTIRGTESADVIVARGGNDTVSGLGGDDIVCGGDGRDTLRGGDGADQLRGEAARDRLVGGPGVDMLIGGPGADSQQQ